ncbi:MAG: four helix bundle protein [Candidatus Sungbacteria bacterium]|uniref:Four helix bundle protein n=1 Tax=Candidatus Sungiibacteriota bacterium TaxID=2750080 RepID=A0A931WNM0_9BACT|nr:four helix bundle protein [Candidatus Sungbacteria bacterium]
MKSDKDNFKTELKQRMYQWTLRLIGMLDHLSKERSSDVISNQLLRSGTSVAANYIEAQAASSRKDFINYLHHALKSANESKYWLALLRDTKKADQNQVQVVLDELIQIANILGSSLMTLKNKR